MSLEDDYRRLAEAKPEDRDAAIRQAKIISAKLRPKGPEAFPARVPRMVKIPSETRPMPTTLYFFRRGPDGPIKIGITDNVKARAKTLSLNCGEEIQVLAVFPGLGKMEKALHIEFAAERLVGEWFSPVQAILAKIEELKSQPSPYREPP